MIKNTIKHINQFKVISFLLLVLITTITCKGNTDDKKEITVVFRFDDYSFRSNTDLELKIIDAFRAKGMSFTIGVIPYVCEDNFFSTSPQNVIPLDSIKGKILRDASLDGTIEIGIHGYSHQTIKEGKNNTEFKGMDFDEQKFRLEKGKKFMEGLTGIEVNTFIPPWNRYDLNTLKAVEQTGFKFFSASTIGDMDATSQLKIVPNTCTLNQLKSAVKNARNSNDKKPYIIVLFHSYDFIESEDDRGDQTLSSFLDLLEWTAAQKDINTLTIDKVATITNDFSPARFAINVDIVELNILLPPFMRPVDTGVYVNKSDLNNIRLRLILFYLVLFIFSFLIGVLTNKILLSRLGIIKTISKYGITILLILAIAYTLKTELAGYKVLIIDAILFGSCLGIWLNDYYKQRKNI